MSEPRASCAMVSSSWAAGDEGLGTGPMPSLPGMEAAGRKRSHLLSGNGTERHAGPNGGEGPQSREEGVCPGISPRPAALLGAGQRRKLVLHIDLNNTILVSDSVTNQSPRAALNSYLSTVSWGMLSPKGEWQWLSDAPSLQPPCPGAVSFYSQYGRSARFTDTPLGRPFSGLHQHHLQLLEWPGPAHPALSTQGEHRKRYHLVLPAFFRLLESLHREGRHFAVIFRTFGTDLPRVLRAVHCALAGQHPHFPALRDLALPVELDPGRIRCSKREVVLSCGAQRLSSRAGCRDLYTHFSSREGLSGFQDHFDWWARNQFSSLGGKPLWIDPHDWSVQHICIDDNIRLDDSDTIVHPQVFSGQGSSCARTVPTAELYDVCLVQTDLLEAIADPSYFCRCVKRCEENYERYLATCAESSP